MNKELKIVLDYADAVAGAEAEIDSGTLDVADALTVLYEKSGWADDPKWLEFKPPRPDALGKINPASRNRFAGWVNWKAEQENRAPLVSRHTHRLLTASDICSRLTQGQGVSPCTERVIRPLGWMKKHGHEDQIPAVWETAVRYADPEPPTSAHVRKALAEWKKTNAPTVKQSIRHNRAESKRIKAVEAVRQLREAGDPAEWQTFLAFLDAMVEEVEVGEIQRQAS